MRLRRRLELYALVLFAIVSVLLLTRFADRPLLLVFAELSVLGLGIFGYRLIAEIFSPLELLRETTHLLGEQDFTTRLRPVGHPEMDQLIVVYNRMTEILRNQRIANQEQEFFFQKVLATTPSAIIVFDFEQRITQLNPAAERFLENSADQLAGKRLEELDNHLAGELLTLPAEGTRIVPLRGRRRLRCFSGRFPDRGFFKRYLIIDELTGELRQIEKRAFEKLIRVMTHEINNSLGAAGSLIHSCLRYAPQIEARDRDDFQTALEVVLSRTEHLKSFMGDYAALAKLPPPDRQPREPAALLENVRGLLAVELDQRQIEWHTEVETDRTIPLDIVQMEQVFLNIVKNAVEAIGRSGRITVRIQASADGKGSVVSIEDSGPGIPAEVEANLFTPFYTTKRDGQGIGLTLVAEILESHGFDFSLETVPPTRFTIWM